MVHVLCAITGALLLSALALMVILACAMWLLGLWNGRKLNLAHQELQAELHTIDRWCAEYPQAVVVIDYLRRWNQDRYNNPAYLRERLRELQPPRKKRLMPQEWVTQPEPED